MPRGFHVYTKAYVMAKSTMWSYPQSDHVLSHWKCAMQCCAKFASVNIPYQEIDDQYSDTSPIIILLVYH